MEKTKWLIAVRIALGALLVAVLLGLEVFVVLPPGAADACRAVVGRLFDW